MLKQSEIKQKLGFEKDRISMREDGLENIYNKARKYPAMRILGKAIRYSWGRAGMGTEIRHSNASQSFKRFSKISGVKFGFAIGI